MTPSKRHGPAGSATSTPHRTTASGSRSSGSARRCAAGRATTTWSRRRSAACSSRRLSDRTSWMMRGFRVPAHHRRSGTSAATGSCAPSTRASNVSGSTTSTSCTCTIPTITGTRPRRGHRRPHRTSRAGGDPRDRRRHEPVGHARRSSSAAATSTSS